MSPMKEPSSNFHHAQIGFLPRTRFAKTNGALVKRTNPRGRIIIHRINVEHATP
jgi:hypothetical protein